MSRTMKILVILLIVDLVGLGGFWFGYTMIQSKKEEQIKLYKERAEEIQKANKATELRRTLSLVAGDYKKINKYFYSTSEENQIWFMTQIEQLGTSTTGILVETKALNFISSDPKRLHGDFSLTGSWGNTYHFLRLIEEFPARIVINRLDLRAGEKDKNTGIREWKGMLTLDLMSIREQQ